MQRASKRIKLNQEIDDVRVQNEELKKQNEELKTRTKELKKQNEELKKQNEELKKQNEELKKQNEEAPIIPKLPKFISEEDFAKCENLCIKNKPDELKVYLDEYCDSIDNSTLILYAAANGGLECIKLLFKGGANIHARKDAAICHAAINGHLECVKFLIDMGATVRTQNDCAIRGAAARGHLACVKLLIKHSADVNANDDYAIRHAAWGKHADVVEFLAESGANVLANGSEIIEDMFRGNYIIDANTRRIIEVYLMYGDAKALSIAKSCMRRAIEQSRLHLANIFHECGVVLEKPSGSELDKYYVPCVELRE